MGARIDELTGRIKQAVGVLTGRRRLERQGQADRQAAEAKRRVAQTRNKVEEAIEQAAGAIEDTIDRARNTRRGKSR
jgi:uncharacterized protein YjbJ (UPF0337 family)